MSCTDRAIALYGPGSELCQFPRIQRVASCHARRIRRQTVLDRRAVAGDVSMFWYKTGYAASLGFARLWVVELINLWVFFHLGQGLG